ncbi:MAG: stage III sporulation protein AB [Clostridia bacterium]|nr:stage III sporulation protein AB [Clostridia bacterium]
MLRLSGAALILTASLLLAVSLSASEQKKLRRSEGLLLLVRHIREQIGCFHAPLPAICASFSHKELEECGFLSVLQQDGLAAALEKSGPALDLSEEELHPLFSFADSLGRGQTEGELRLCDHTATELEKTLAKRREELPRRTRVLQTLFVSGALMLVILLF